MFRAEEWGLRKRNINPCLGIAENPRNCVARFLDSEEVARLGQGSTLARAIPESW